MRRYTAELRKRVENEMVKKLSTIVNQSREFVAHLNFCMSENAITTALRASHFLSQCAHESGNFRVFEENLNYSALRLLQVFPKYFPSTEVASQYARNPQKIASRVYANRMGNGSEESGEGWKYRGRGIIQLTGKNNYKAYADATLSHEIMENPDAVKDYIHAINSAAWYWNSRNLNDVADKGSDEGVILLITKKVNGGINGLHERQKKFNEIYKILSTNNN